MKKRFSVLILFTVITLSALAGCSLFKYEKLETDGVSDYLSEHYGGNFTILSVTEQGEENRYCLDPDMNDENPNNAEDDSNTKDIIYKVKDENGTEFFVVAMYDRQIMGSHYAYYDDYCIQLLNNNSDFITKLSSFGFPTEYFNGIGSDNNDTYYALKVSSYDDIPSAAEAVCEILSDESFAVPYYNKEHETVDSRSLVPKIKVFCDNEYTDNYVLCSHNFIISGSSSETDATEAFTRVMEWNYADKARKTGEPLSAEVFNKYPPERIKDISYNGEKINGDLYYGRKSQSYENDTWIFDSFVFWCTGYKISEKDEAYVRYDDLEEFLTDLGYKCEYKNSTAIYTYGDRVTTISESDSEYECTVNGEVYEPEGIVSHMMKITQKDMEAMFGITFDIDRVNATAEAFVN